MRHIYVQHCNTKLFLREGDAWTNNMVNARDFGTSLNAMAHCLTAKMSGAQVVVKFDTPGAADVVVPVQATQ